MAEPGYLSFCRRVHHVLIAGEFVLLDEKRDCYLLLDESDSRDLLAGFSGGVAIGACEKYRAAGLIEFRAEPQAINSAPSRRHGIGNHSWAQVGSYRDLGYGTMQSFIALVLVIGLKAWMKVFGFGAVVALARHAARRMNKGGKKVLPDTGRRRLQSMAAAVYGVGLRVPIKVQCLESSLALHLFACLAGIGCVFKIGVQRYDFLAHAWVEFDGSVVGDSAALSTTMPVILKIEPGEER